MSLNGTRQTFYNPVFLNRVHMKYEIQKGTFGWLDPRHTMYALKKYGFGSNFIVFPYRYCVPIRESEVAPHEDYFPSGIGGFETSGSFETCET